jgi:acetolactate synthase I/III small subunit
MPPEPFVGATTHSPVSHHIFSVLVENKAGVLSRVAGLFSRRGFNIYSLAVAPADDDERFSRITIVVDAESAPLEQIRGQLNKLINVVEIRDLAQGEAVERELLLATVKISPEARGALLRDVAHAGAAIIDFSNDAVTVSLSGTPAAIDSFEATLDDRYGGVEIQRTGRVALSRLTPTA